MKKIAITFGFIILITSIFIYGLVSPQIKITKQFPVNNPETEYYVNCSGSMYVLGAKENKLSDVSGLFIGSSPIDLQPLCEQEVNVNFSIRKFKGQGLCINNDCKSTKSPVIDISSISKK